MKAALRISDRDNVATALEPLASGRALVVEGIAVTARADIPSGHKIALREIASGQPVIKYGSPIGLATSTILPGEHVHTHNVASSRGRGDLDAAANGARTEPRLAEPSDEEAGAPGVPPSA